MPPTDLVIDAETGEVRFAKPAGPVYPRMERQAFLIALPGKKFAAAGMSGDVHQYDHEQAVLGNAQFLATALFRDDRLVGLSLIHNDPNFSAGPWSADDNRRLHEFHNNWLTAMLGNRRQFCWGTVSSNCDIKSGFISIDLCFST